MIDVILCALVGFVAFLSSYGVWQAIIESRIVRSGPPKRSARMERERRANRRQAHLRASRGARRGSAQ